MVAALDRGTRRDLDNAAGKGGQPSRTALCTYADEKLIHLAALGSSDAFEEIHDRHAGRAFGVALRTTGSAALAEDVVQDAFLSLWRAAPRYRANGAGLRAWLLTIVRNRAVDEVRRRATEERRWDRVGPVDEADAGAAPDVEVVRRHEAVTVRAALDGLPEAQRQVLALAFIGGMSQAEIAAALNLPVGTVKGRWRLGLEKLRRALADAA